MTIEYSVMCLEQSGWDLLVAAARFEEVKASPLRDPVSHSMLIFALVQLARERIHVGEIEDGRNEVKFKYDGFVLTSLRALCAFGSIIIATPPMCFYFLCSDILALPGSYIRHRQCSALPHYQNFVSC